MMKTKKEVDLHVKDLLTKSKSEMDRKTRGFSIARLYYNVKEFEHGRKYLDEFLSVRPKSVDGHKFMGQINEKLGKKNNAISSYKLAYTLSDSEKDLIPKICRLLIDSDADMSTQTYFAEEGEKYYPHHNNVISLRHSLITITGKKSNEELISMLLGEVKLHQSSLDLHVKLAKQYLEWGKECSKNLEEAYEFVLKVESRKPFPHSLDWYKAVIDIFKAYEKWKKPKDIIFKESFLSLFDRYVFESLASCLHPGLSSMCSVQEAMSRLEEFEIYLVNLITDQGDEYSSCQHMMSEFYFFTALLIFIRGQNESILHKDMYICSLLLKSLHKIEKSDITTTDPESVKYHWLSYAAYRVSQSSHILRNFSTEYASIKEFLDKVDEMTLNQRSIDYIHNLAFQHSSRKSSQPASLLFTEHFFRKGHRNFVDDRTQLQYDQEVIESHSDDLREMIWLYLQYSNKNSEVSVSKLFTFHFFPNIPFTSTMNSFAPKTLCHMDLVAFLTAVVFCQEKSPHNGSNEVKIYEPSILVSQLFTPEQGEWWSAASTLCKNRSNRSINRLRSILQNGLESIRHLGHHVLPLELTLHLARFFANNISQVQNHGVSPNEIISMQERAEHYWSKVVSQCMKQSKGIFSSVGVKSRLFEIIGSWRSIVNFEEIEEEGQLFIVDRLVKKGKFVDAIHILSKLRGAQASFKKAKLCKEQAQSILGNRVWHSLNLNARKEYSKLLEQSRDSLYLTLDRLKMPEMDSSDPLNSELALEMTSIEHCLDSIREENDERDSSDRDASTPRQFSYMNLTNGNASEMVSFNDSNFAFADNMFSTPITHRNKNRQEARPSSERLDAQVRHLTDLQQNTIKNLEGHNSALRAQNDVLQQTCHTMVSELKNNVSFYKHFIECKKEDVDSIAPLMDQMKQLNVSVQHMQTDMSNVKSKVGELCQVKAAPRKPDPLSLLPLAADPQVDLTSPAALQNVYNNYMGFTQPIQSPLAAHTAAMFGHVQAPFLPPTSLQDHLLYSTAIKAEAAQAAALLQAAQREKALAASAVASIKNESKPLVNNVKTTTQSSDVKHQYHINLPSTSQVSLSAPQVSIKSENVFTTAGLLSNVPAPMYSAVTPIFTDKGRASIAMSTSIPVTQPLAATITSFASSQANVAAASTKLVSVKGTYFPGPPENHHDDSKTDDEHYVEEEYDPRPDFEPLIPLPDKITPITGEENEKVLFEERAKLFRFVDKEWKERGLGPIKILHDEKEKTVRVLMRREQTHKICCNHFIASEMQLTPYEGKNALIWAAQDFADETLINEKFCCRFKTAESVLNFKNAFEMATNIAKDAKNSEKLADKTDQASKVSSKPLAELFKLEPGSWSCSVCLVQNKKVDVKCAACLTIKPGAHKQEVSHSKEQSAGTFKFGLTPQATTSSFVMAQSSAQFISTSSTAPTNDVATLSAQLKLTVSSSNNVVSSLLFKSVPPTSTNDEKLSVDLFEFSKTEKIVPKSDRKEEKDSKSKEKLSIFSSFKFTPETASEQTKQPSFTFNLSAADSSVSTASPIFGQAAVSIIQTEAIFNTPATSSLSFSAATDGRVSAPSTTGGSFSGPATTGGIFSTSATCGIVGTTASNFGSTSTAGSIFGSTITTGSVFGGTSATKSIFGNNPTTESVLSDTPTTKSIFGNTPTTVSVLGGTPTTKSIFDDTSTKVSSGTPTMTKSIFGGTPSTGGVFGGTLSTGSVFGATPTTKCIFGGTPTTKSIFSGTPTTGSVFGGIPTTNDVFGGAPKTTASNFDTSTGSIFGAAATTTTGSLFGNQAAETLLSFGSASTNSASVSFKESEYASEQAFKPRPLFEKPQDINSVEEFEPQVDFEPVIALPELVQANTGEEDEHVMFCERAKLFRFVEKEWKERGVGDIKILKNEKSNTTRIIMRRDQTLKICANHFISQDLKLLPNGEKSWVWAAQDYADSEVKLEKLAVRFKNTELAKSFHGQFLEAQKFVAENKDRPASETVKKVLEELKPLSELFKPAAGSWECQTCLVLNSADKDVCASCGSRRDGSLPTQSETKPVQLNFGLPQSTSSTETFKFGLSPQVTSSSFVSSNSNVQIVTASAEAVRHEVDSIQSKSTVVSSINDAASKFSFGIQTTSTTTLVQFQVTSTAPTSSTQTSMSTSQPFSFQWNPQKVFSTPVSSEPHSESKGFSFGSPKKYDFSFTAAESPRSREVSVCESESSVVSEQEDNLYFEPVIALPQRVDVVTGEEDERTLFTHRSKLFRLRNQEYKERGLGDVKILQHNKSGKIRLLMRREHVHKVCLNHYLTKDLVFRQKDEKSYYWIATDFSEGEALKETFAIRFKTSEIASSFLNAVEEAKALLLKVGTLDSPAKAECASNSEEKEATILDEEDISIVCEKRATKSEVEKARKLQLPDNFFSPHSESCPGCLGCEPDMLPNFMLRRSI